jgi:T3SS negative regulator,GrlR
MRRGIYRIETTRSQTSAEGIAMINNNGIRGLDNDYIYTGRLVAKHGKRGWSFSVERYGKSGRGFSIRRFSATIYGDEGEREFRLSGESDADANTKVAIHGRWVAVL